MQWNPNSVARHTLTVLMMDIRGSSAVFTARYPDTVRRFVKEFSDLTNTIVSEVVPDLTNGNEPCYNINSFLGDGFLIFLADPDEHAPVLLGPARAVMIAHRMRIEFSKLCEQFQLGEPDEPRLDRLHLVTGITHGSVFYGPFAAPTVKHSTGMTKTVVLSARLSKIRNGSSISRPDYILICSDTYEQVRGVIVSRNLPVEMNDIHIRSFQERRIRLQSFGITK